MNYSSVRQFTMDIKNFTFKHIEKFALGITVCCVIYAIIHTIIISSLEVHEIDTKLLSLSNVIDRKLKISMPPDLNTELKDASQLESRLTNPPPASFLQRPYLFGKFVKGEPVPEVTTEDLYEKSELPPLSQSEGTNQGDTEFILKGGTADMALIQVRKLDNDKWLAESFTVKKGGAIGREKTIRKKPVDFNTHCKLVEIIPFAQKPLVIKKTSILRNEKGEFLGTALTEEIYMISTSKIVFEDKKGDPYNLWIGELANLGTETVTVHSALNTSSTN